MGSNGLVFGAATRPPSKLASRDELGRARLALARLQPWAVKEMLRIYRKPETTDAMRVTIIRDFMDRGGLPKRTDVDIIDERFTVAEMRAIFRDVAREHLTNPQGGMVEAVDAEFSVEPMTNGNGAGPK